jgi:hypothetical protein
MCSVAWSPLAALVSLSALIKLQHNASRTSATAVRYRLWRCDEGNIRVNGIGRAIPSRCIDQYSCADDSDKGLKLHLNLYREVTMHGSGAVLARAASQSTFGAATVEDCIDRARGNRWEHNR